jgi:hypothetical protein
MDIYLRNDRTFITTDMTATHITVTHWTKRMEGQGHELFVCMCACMHTSSIFSLSDLFDDVTKKKISCCSTLRSNRKGLPHDLPLPNK